MLFTICVDSVGIHLFSKLFHLLLIKVELLSCINVYLLTWVDFSPISSHLIALTCIKIILSEGLCLNESLIFLYRIFYFLTLYLDFFRAKEFVICKKTNICFFIQFHILPCLARKECCLFFSILCTSYVLVRKWLTKFSLNFQQRLRIRPEIHGLKWKQIIWNFSGIV